ncbi:helix-turn-helix domain-containing protein [Paenibacillus eucommiae]|uniref:AraC-like DNA-binding protein/1,2-phenylacetyl-CoA epoxidase catalytic subunit n=1 Tax=Paenibacillus eucommiae TaxID=1355755 RepID=A0ABS4JAJ4_9BACL|nr:helix-turn-helix domain-containing protein [Paenibacillus eucommiae]MBP1996116.1 AraC-like DNA-binding protein/1,2-phenylacetyl-CoA epoxidase catalytic subunit [Paenibacillus eucommiae]
MRIKRLHRIQLSYLPVLFVVGLSLLFIVYLTLSEVTKQSALKANNILSYNIIQTIDESLKRIDTAITGQLLKNEKVRRFFESEYTEDRQYWDYQTVAVLNEMMDSHPLISSINLYRISDNMLLTPTTFTRLDNFGDKQFIGKQLSALLPFRWTERRPYAEQPGVNESNVVSLVKFASLSDRSLVVVHVDTERLSRLILDMAESGFQYIELLDTEGKRIASRDWADPSMHGRNVRENGKEWSKASSAYTGWTVSSGVYKGSIIEWISSLFYVWIALGFLIIAAGIAWLVYLTRRNYRPIQSISQRMNEYFRQKQQELKLEDQDDELQYIETAIEKLFDQSSQLLEQNKENLAYRRRYVFLQLLEGAVAGQVQEWKEEIGQFGYSLTDCGLLVTMIEIDDYNKFNEQYNHRDQYLLKYVLSTVLHEMAEPVKLCIWTEWVERHQLGLLFLLDRDGGMEEDVFELLGKMTGWAERHLPYTVTVGVGSCESDAANIAESYEQALEALSYKTSLGTNRLIRSADFAAKTPFELVRQAQRVRSICQSFRAGDGEWERHWNDMFEELWQQLVSKEDLIGLLNYLVYQLHREMAELPEEFQAIWNGGAHAELNGVGKQRETMESIREEYVRVLRETAAQMRELRESKHNHHLIRSVKQYVNDHYNNPDLSHAQLESEFGLAASYLSRLFKEEFGVKFIDYLSQTRIEKAIELLKEHPDKTVQAIAEQVGYLHGITFIRAFKKYTGSTPGNFRKDLI